ncbi:hypothetical protein H9Q69_009362 [Fusarium xylarioides]|uniref:Uncharacterized protein n=1 Tax=Fusarium xylarioides TaxID=221167 RepID=A0A9P7HER6_9HYPO|nr:hypothetical protein H9Q70_004345 [Fusarium xylarioides]KAG5758018.1 hypothetical protein H9Q72_013847 [Fusarium xylarioides]KAG5781676.1 hypothetical protein H9Q73_004689 [Fusarium xylarioides]KAG5791603.1 hypothetical protein H9Q69_009362 [Fusarium xylarioides]
MSQQENIEAKLVKHKQACETLHEKLTKQFTVESNEAFSQTLETVSNVLKIDHMVRSSKTESAFENLGRTSQEIRVDLYDATRLSLKEKQQETTALREEYEAKLKAKDEEIKALKESVNDLRENRRDKDDMIATTKEMNIFLLSQLQELKELYKAKEENMRLLMAEQKKQAETRLEAAPRRKLPAHARF